MIKMLTHTATITEYEIDYSNGKTYKLISYINEIMLGEGCYDPESCGDTIIQDLETGEELIPDSDLFREIMKNLESGEFEF
jgi:hypothetical protein